MRETAKEAYRAAMREDLLAAAGRVVDERGFGGLTIRAILDEAGVARGTLYSYFSGKEAILEALADRALAQYLENVPDAGAGTREGFWRFIEAAFTAPPVGVDVLAELRGTPSDEQHAAFIARMNRDLVHVARDIFGDLIDPDSGITDVEAFTELLDIVWDGMARRAAAGTFVTDFERVGSIVLTLAAGTLRAPGPDHTAN